MRNWNYLILLIFLLFFLKVFSSNSSKIIFEVSYIEGSGSISEYIEIIQLRLEKNNILIENIQTDFSNSKISFIIDSEITTKNICLLLSTNNKLSLYSTLDRSFFKKELSGEYFNNIVLDDFSAKKYLNLNSQIIGFSDTLIDLTLDNSTKIMTDFKKDRYLSSYLIYYLDTAHLNFEWSEIVDFQVIKNEYNYIDIYDICIILNELAGERLYNFTKSRVNEYIAITIDKSINSSPRIAEALTQKKICIINFELDEVEIYKSIFFCPSFKLEINSVNYTILK